MPEPKIETVMDVLNALRAQQEQGYVPEQRGSGHIPLNVLRPTDSSVELSVPLPGVAKERITLKIEEDNNLNVTVCVAAAPDQCKYSHQEFDDYAVGHEERIKLPLKLAQHETVGEIKAHWANGVLYIHASKKSSKRPARTIRVE